MTKGGEQIDLTRIGPGVTVVVPCFNAEVTLRGTLDSVISQTYQNWSLVVVDDGSTDSSGSILAEYENLLEERIKVIRSSNRGACHARNLALANSNTAFVAFLDADDLWEPTKLSLQINYLMEHPDAVGVTVWYQIVSTSSASGLESRAFGWTKPEMISWTLLGSKAPALNSTLLVLRESILSVGGYDESLGSHADDLDLGWRLFHHGRLGVVEDLLVTLQVSEGQAHRQLIQMEESLRIVFAKVAKFDEKLSKRALDNLRIYLALRRLALEQRALRKVQRVLEVLLHPVSLVSFIAQRIPPSWR